MAEQDLPAQHQDQVTINQPLQAIFTAQAVSDIVKDAVGGVKSYIDAALNAQKQESDKVIESTTHQFEQLKKSAQVQFRFRGNKNTI